MERKREGQKEGERKRDSEVILRRGRDKGRGSKRYREGELKK